MEARLKRRWERWVIAKTAERAERRPRAKCRKTEIISPGTPRNPPALVKADGYCLAFLMNSSTTFDMSKLFPP